MTYSIVAIDRKTGEIGAAVQSHYFAVGRRCLTLLPGVGAAASQSFGSAAHGPLALERLRTEATEPARIVADLAAADEARALRQVLLIDAHGRTGAYTGSGCVAAAGSAAGPDAVAAGNMLEADCWTPMVDAFHASSGPLEYRLLAALDAAQAAGGDLRGQMSAALRVVGPTPTEFLPDGTRVDIRVDAAAAPLDELRRLVDLGTAHRVLSHVVFAPGASAGASASAEMPTHELLAQLAQTAEVMDPDPEPVFWQGIAAWRAGMHDLAAERLRRAVAERTQYAQFLEAVAAAGFVQMTVAEQRTLLGAP